MRPLRVLALLLCASTLALAASGCGGSTKTYSGTKPEAWAATVCGALGDWAQGLKDDSALLGSDLSGTTDLNVVKAKFIAFLEKAERSSRTMVTRIGAAGPPAVKQGAAIEQQLVTGLRGAQTSFTRAIARARKLPTTNVGVFTAGVQALGGEVQKELTAVGQKFTALGDTYKDNTLHKATSGEPSCKKISG